MELNELWGQFKTEARSGYALYSKDLHKSDYSHLPHWKQFFHLAGDFFWAVMNKLSPARRILLLAGLVLVVLGSVRVEARLEQNLEFVVLGALLILTVLVMEISDRIIMKRDLEIAREIQSWLVPSVAPQIPTLDIAFVSRPANTVAGDYYDVLPIGAPGSGRYLLAVADVAGKSLPAALLMATFQASLHTLTGSCDSLIPLVEGVNLYACKHSRGGQRFTTAFLAILNINSGELVFCNSGHNAPMLRRASGAIERLEAGGLPLGIMPNAHYDCGTVTVAPGDALVVFTDGVVEANNDREEEFGEDRLIPIVQDSGASRAVDFIQTLTLEINRFVGQARQHDDITCLVIRREAAPVAPVPTPPQQPV